MSIKPTQQIINKQSMNQNKIIVIKNKLKKQRIIHHRKNNPINKIRNRSRNINKMQNKNKNNKSNNNNKITVINLLNN